MSEREIRAISGGAAPSRPAFNAKREEELKAYRVHALALTSAARAAIAQVRPIGAKLDERERKAIEQTWEGILALETSLAIRTPFEAEILRNKPVDDAWSC